MSEHNHAQHNSDTSSDQQIPVVMEPPYTQIPEQQPITFENTTAEPVKSKSSIWSLLLGIILIIRGGMRMAEGQLEILGIAMVAIGIISIVVYIRQQIANQ